MFKPANLSGFQNAAGIISFVHFLNEFSLNERRINVAISRSRTALLCVGNHQMLLKKGHQESLARLALMFSNNGAFSHRRLHSSRWTDIFIDGGIAGQQK